MSSINTMIEFEAKLTSLGMSKALFAKKTGTPKPTIYGWKKAPNWALAYLTVLLDLQRIAKDCLSVLASVQNPKVGQPCTATHPNTNP